jgi:hypothetical protein
MRASVSLGPVERQDGIVYQLIKMVQTGSGLPGMAQFPFRIDYAVKIMIEMSSF